MKLLIYCEHFLPLVGGVQTSVDLLARGLVESGALSRTRPFEQNRVTVITRTPAGEMNDSTLSYRVVRKPSIWQLIRLIRDADVLHLSGACLAPMVIAWLVGKPAVVQHHGYHAVCPNGLLFLQPSQMVCSGHFMEKRYSACLHCCSETMGWLKGARSVMLTFPRRWFCKRVAINTPVTNHVAKRVALPRTRTIYHGVDVITPRQKNGPPVGSQGPQIAYVGRFVTEKGLPVLLKAAHSLNENHSPVRILLIGDGPERIALEEMVKGFNLNGLVTFAGVLKGAALEAAVNNAELLVMPSVCEETAGLAAIEQMMRGRPVIAANIGGLGEVVGDGGMKFVPSDSGDLASCIQQVIRDPSLAASLGSAGRARALQYFTVEFMIKAYASLYQELLAG